MSLKAVHAEIRSGWPEVPATELCVYILDFMARRSSDQLRMLTFPDLARIADQPKVNSQLLTALNILKELSILEFHAIFVDFDQQEYEIESSDLKEAEESGEFFHPRSGEPVEDFRSKIIPFFAASDRFFEELRRAG